jgi:hypothetical protein
VAKPALERAAQDRDRDLARFAKQALAKLK